MSERITDALEDSRMSVREDKSVSVDPLRVVGAEAEELAPQNVGGGSHTHGSTRVTRVGLCDDIGSKGSDGAAG